MLNRVQKTHFPALLFNNKMRQVGQKMTVKFYYIFFASSFFFSTFLFPFLYLAFLFGMRDDKFTNVLPFSRSHLIFILFSANISFYWLPFYFACLPSAEVEPGLALGLVLGSGGSRWASRALCCAPAGCAFAMVGLGSLPVNFINIFMMRLGDRTVIWARKCCHAPLPALLAGQRHGGLAGLGFLRPHAKCFVVFFSICCCHTQP